MHSLQIQLLGNFRVRCNDALVKISSQRLQDFLVYLLLHRGNPQNRHQLSSLFWPESSDAQAQTNLRNLLYVLRKEFSAVDDFLTTDSQCIAWSQNSALSLDVEKFELLTLQARDLENSHDSGRLESILENSIGTYKGDLVPSCYADWIVPHRSRLLQLYLRSFERLISVKEMQSKYQEAIDVAHRLLDVDPLNEENYRNLIRINSLIGNRAAAVRIYYDCVETMQRELNVEPSIITRQLYEQLIKMAWRPAPQSSEVLDFPVNFPLVGRQREWKQLLSAWQRAEVGNTSFAIVIGENGLGKTHLGEEFIRWAYQAGILTASTRCFPGDNHFAFAPIIAWLRSRPLPSLNDIQLAEIARLLPELRFGRPDLPKPVPLLEHWQRQHFFDAVVDALLANRRPSLIFIDDLQWLDRDTLQFFYYLLRFNTRLPLLIIGSIPPEDIDKSEVLTQIMNTIRASGQLTEISLGELSEEQTALLVKNLAEVKLSQSQISRVFQETRGNPLFLVEMIRAGWFTNLSLAQGNEISFPSLLPRAIQSMIEKRLANLSVPAKELIDIASVIGHSFTFSLLSAVSGMSENLALDALDELWQRRILRETGPETYDFSQDKLREAVYANLSLPRLRILQRRITIALSMLDKRDEPQGNVT
jgi:DNA-binding SARP family transcriptional activator